MSSCIAGLSYVVIGTSDLDEWRRFGSEVLGVMVTPGHRDSQIALRMDVRMARMIVDDTLPPGVQTVAWEVRNEHDWNDLLSRLEANGTKFELLDADEAHERYATAVARCEDPSGAQVEFVLAPYIEPIRNFISPTGARFVTDDQGMGHTTGLVANYDETKAFYIDLLGFTVRETVKAAITGTFASCNSRQHTIALLDGGDLNILHHIMLEVDSIDEVGRCWDRVVEGGATLVTGMGRHYNDHMISFYLTGPDGVTFEYGYGGLRIDPEATVEVRQSGRGGGSFWGHHPVVDDPAFAHH